MKSFIANSRMVLPEMAPSYVRSTLPHHTASFYHRLLLCFLSAWNVGTYQLLNLHILLLYVHVCTIWECRYGHAQCANGGQRTTFENWLFPSTLGSRNQTRLVGLARQVILPTEPSHWSVFINFVCFHCKTTKLLKCGAYACLAAQYYSLVPTVTLDIWSAHWGLQSKQTTC